jgi:hypothetical protein
VRPNVIALLGAALIALFGFAIGRATADAYLERAAEWELTALSADERTLTITYQTGHPACHSERTSLFETTRSVEITVLIREKRNVGCEDIGVTKTETIELAEPLGFRRLLNRGTGRSGKVKATFCTPAIDSPPCGRSQELDTAYPVQLVIHCGVMTTYLDGRWWRPDRPRRVDYGDPAVFGWQWTRGPSGIARPIRLNWSLTSPDLAKIDGALRLISSETAVFERPMKRSVGFVPAKPPRWCSVLQFGEDV